MSAPDSRTELTRRLLDEAGTTYAQQAGIHLTNTPMPLFQLLVLAMLAAKPIHADTATAAARELWGAGLRTPGAVLGGDRARMIEAFGRAGYARYDESSATRLTDMATMVRDDYHGDLRGLAERAGGDTGEAARLLTRFKGIGATGAAIFLREVQDAWPWVRPYFDERARQAAGQLGLPTDPDRLGALACGDNARLAAALERVSRDERLMGELTGS
ncbi:HhH-GDP family DNA glycosylase [Mycolicibacterium palauense]|uniref:endonuclease n=1 Tax=Mycolicibacterium palauense TaxID=2034511 RepID=UPI000BFED2F3|nr:endonuclease [Mycolicibacterium palauense]